MAVRKLREALADPNQVALLGEIFIGTPLRTVILIWEAFRRNPHLYDWAHEQRQLRYGTPITPRKKWRKRK